MRPSHYHVHKHLSPEWVNGFAVIGDVSGMTRATFYGPSANDHACAYAEMLDEGAETGWEKLLASVTGAPQLPNALPVELDYELRAIAKCPNATSASDFAEAIRKVKGFDLTSRMALTNALAETLPQELRTWLAAKLLESKAAA